MALATTSLYHDPTSEPSRAVQWFALEAGIDIDLGYVWLARNEHHNESFLAINPRHQVPALCHDGFCLSEAAAIIAYLAEISGQRDRWFGADARARARTAMLLSWYHTNLRLRLTLDYFLPVLLYPTYDGATLPSVERIEALRAAVRLAFGHIEVWLSGTTWLAGDEIGAADIIFVADCTTLWSDPDASRLTDGFPRLLAWIDRCGERNAFALSHAPWAALALRMREDLSTGIAEPRDRRWVADHVEQFLSGDH